MVSLNWETKNTVQEFLWRGSLPILPGKETMAGGRQDNVKMLRKVRKGLSLELEQMNL